MQKFTQFLRVLRGEVGWILLGAKLREKKVFCRAGKNMAKIRALEKWKVIHFLRSYQIVSRNELSEWMGIEKKRLIIFSSQKILLSLWNISENCRNWREMREALGPGIIILKKFIASLRQKTNKKFQGCEII